eukprot:2550565-Heterocapsa_arctica.AAC.1
MEGNREADKFAKLGVEMHAVPEIKVEEVQAQDRLVKDLLKMIVEVMKGVHDKASLRKKEDMKTRTEGSQLCFHGPKTGAHGAHVFEVREEGGWKCGVCSKRTTTHMGWRRMVRTPCGTRAKASRAKWKLRFDRRLWGRIGARKVAAGDQPANHKAVRIQERRWI